MKKLLLLILRIGVTVLLGWIIYNKIDFEPVTITGRLKPSPFPGQMVVHPPDSEKGRLVPVAMLMVVQTTEDGVEQLVPATDFTRQELEGRRGTAEIQGIAQTIREAKLGLLLVTACMPALMYLLAAVRWRLLLAGQGIHLPLARALWLFWVGQFFSMALPGITGGDLVKAFYVTRRTHRKASAIASIVVDRVMGLSALLFIAIIVALATFARFSEGELWFVPWILIGSMVCIVLGAVVFFSKRVRRITRFEKILALLPFGHLLQKMDQAFLEFRDAKRSVAKALGISLVIHVMLISANCILGASVGITEARYFHYATFIPIIFALSSLPISMGGLGVRESLYGVLLGSVGAAVNQAVLVSLLFWFSSLVWALPGGVLYALRKDTMTAHEMEEQMESTDSESDDDGTHSDG